MQIFLIVIWFCISVVSLGSESENIRQIVGECSEPDRTKGGNVGVILPSSPSCPWRLRYGSFGILSQVSKQRIIFAS